MFPHEFSVALSLKPNSPCLTLSSLILSTGEVKEVKMTAGKIKEMVRLHPRAVDKILGRRDPEIASLTIGGTHEEAFEVSEVRVREATQHLDVLKKAQEVCKARLERRLLEVPEPLDMVYNDANFDVWVSFAEDTNKFDRSQSRHFVGDPIIHVSSARHARSDKASRRYLVDSLITQLMSVASEMAGLWCRQREIPTIYQASLTKPGFPPSKLSNLERHEKRVEPRHQLSSTPLPHVLINCNQYMRFTSPLRRYSDLIGLWQIDAYLKQDGKSQTRIIGYDNAGELPFSKVQLDEYISDNAQTIKDLDRLMSRSKTHWTYQAFFRAFHFKEATLPEFWDLRIERFSNFAGVTKEDDSGLRGRLIPFNINELRVLKSEEGYEKSALVGQYLPVKIELVDVELPTMVVKAVGPPSDKPTTTQPIKIAANVKSAPPQLGKGLTRGAEQELDHKSETLRARKERGSTQNARRTNKVGW
jgi:RNB domain